MKASTTRFLGMAILAAAPLTLLPSRPAHAMLDGVMGQTTFNLTAKADHLTTGEGGVLLFWGLANEGGRAQYTAPTLVLMEGDMVTINLVNQLPVATSLVFPGQEDVQASGGQPGLLTREAAAGGGSVQYMFTAAHPGTYLYYSGTSPELQVEMGLVGAMIVRPANFNAAAPTAYGSPDSAYTYEVLMVSTEMDPRIHDLVEAHGVDALLATDYLSNYRPNYWFLNGRNAPDTMFESNVPYLPTQPYNCMPMMHPGDTLLIRGIGGGRDMHPMHFHGNHFRVLARDGRLLQSTPGAVADLSAMVFTNPVIPGQTYDATYQWTGEKLGWDIYGTGPDHVHSCRPDASGFDVTTKEYCADHGKPIPVVLPDIASVSPGRFYSGSPYLGSTEEMVPGQGGMNPAGAFTYMWHSHQERDMTNYDVFPGGMMTMLVIVPPGAPIP